MTKQNKVDILKNNMNELMINFLNMSSNDRINYINNLSHLSSIEHVVLIQCRKYMSPEEKRVYKKAKDLLSQQEENQSQPE